MYYVGMNRVESNYKFTKTALIRAKNHQCDILEEKKHQNTGGEKKITNIRTRRAIKEI